MQYFILNIVIIALKAALRNKYTFTRFVLSINNNFNVFYVCVFFCCCCF